MPISYGDGGDEASKEKSVLTETAGDRLGHLVDLTPRDIRELRFDEGGEGTDHEGNDFTLG